MIVYNGIEIGEVAFEGGLLTVRVPDIRFPKKGDFVAIDGVSRSISDVEVRDGNWLLTIEADE